jgi:hypothetical protein
LLEASSAFHNSGTSPMLSALMPLKARSSHA